MSSYSTIPYGVCDMSDGRQTKLSCCSVEMDELNNFVILFVCLFSKSFWRYRWNQSACIHHFTGISQWNMNLIGCIAQHLNIWTNNHDRLVRVSYQVTVIATNPHNSATSHFKHSTVYTRIVVHRILWIVEFPQRWVRLDENFRKTQSDLYSAC